MSSWYDRKNDRKEYFEKYIKGWKLRNCSACSGSGYYDNDGSPPCGGCNGTGKERYKPNETYKNKLVVTDVYDRKYWPNKIPPEYVAVVATYGGDYGIKKHWFLVPTAEIRQSERFTENFIIDPLRHKRIDRLQ